MDGEIGAGGMGVVYRANEIATGRPVAVKYLTQHLARNALERFRREATALAELHHPNVVRVLAVNFSGRAPYFTMAYAPGGTLARKLLADGPLPPAAAAALIGAIADGLAAAHAVGIVHRDVKPSNILLADDGTPVLADFGLARRTDAAATLTGVQAVVGTPHYMSPEQADGFADVGPEADVYSLGATLFEALTGRPPFVGDVHHGFYDRLKFEYPPAARVVNPGVPRALSAIAEKCLQKRPSSRYATAEALAEDLARWRAGERVSAKPSSTAARVGRAAARRWKWAAAAGVVAAAVGAGMVLKPVAYAPAPKSLSGEFVADELRAGRSVVLVGESGPPAYSRWKVGTAPFTPEPGDGTACFFAPKNYGLLELLPESGPEEYRLTLELRHYPVPGAGPDRSQVGPYFAAREATGLNGERALAAQCVLYSDTAPNGVPGNPANVVRSRIALLSGITPEDATVTWRQDAAATFPRGPAGVPGPWRRFVIDVTRMRVVATAVDLGRNDPPVTVADTAQADVAVQFKDFQSLAAAAAKNPPPVPGWSLRGAAGVWSYRGGVAFKNATISRPPP